MYNISAGAIKAIRMLTEAGFEAYAVGGAIRDILMGRVANDFDITTGATPEQMKDVFKNERVVETGIAHGTLTLVCDGECVEITTYRVDGEYIDNRHPESVEFTTDISYDLSRRDFTVNALAYNPITDRFLDLFGGREDIDNKIIRAIGEPSRRFGEDALRILRGLRFSSTLGFEIEPSTARAMLECAPLLANISRERIATELNKLLCGENASAVILKGYDVLSYIVPELKQMNGFDQKTPWHVYDILEHTARTVENVPPDLHLRLAALLHDIGKVHTFSVDEGGQGHFYGHGAISERRAREFFEEYKYDNATRDAVCKLISLHDTYIDEDKIYIKKRLNRIGKEAFFDLVALQRADNLAQNPERVNLEHFDRVIALASEIISEAECFSLRDLKINGDDLVALGVKPGKRIGELLQLLLNEVIEEKTENERQALLKRVEAEIGE